MTFASFCSRFLKSPEPRKLPLQRLIQVLINRENFVINGGGFLIDGRFVDDANGRGARFFDILERPAPTAASNATP